MTSDTSGHRRWLPLALVLLAGLLLRLALWDNLPRQGFISDEAEYLAAANWLALGRGFTWHQGWLWTRAPLYPLFLAAHLRVFGTEQIAPIYCTQLILSLVNVVLISIITLQAGGGRGRPALLAAGLATLFLPFATHPFMLLSETLYLTLLLGAWAILGQWAGRSGGLLLAALAGGLLGLATLTRGLTLGFLPLVALWMVWARHVSLCRFSPPGRVGRSVAPLVSRILPAGVFLLVCGGVVLPWSLYASNIYGGRILVDTTSAYNMLLGTRTAYDGSRRDTPVRQFVLALLDERLSGAERREMVSDSCLFQQHDEHLLAAMEQPAATLTQGQRQQLMMTEAWCLFRAAPTAFLQKSLGELVSFFQINYTGDERMSGGFTLGRLPRWYTLALFLLSDTLYVATLPLAVFGWARIRQQTRRRQGEAGAALAGLAVLWAGYILLTTPLLFAINRFRLPLLPFVFVYAALALAGPRQESISRTVRTFLLTSPLTSLVVLLLLLITLTPYAYLQEPPASLASYLGPYPSSLAATHIAWETRPTGLRDQQLVAALGQGDATRARELLTAGGISRHTRRVALPLLAGLEGKPRVGLALLQTQTYHQVIVTLLDGRLPPTPEDWRAAVVRGDLLRRSGDIRGAKAAFTPGYVDDQTPVAWAWDWLSPPPTRRIDLAGNADLGYIRGFYLGEGDPSAGGTFRWSGDEARLLFPQQGRTTPQGVCLRVDGRGWPTDLPTPHARLFLATTKDGQSLTPLAPLEIAREVQVECVPLPPTVDGADIVLVLRCQTFVPAAADLLNQQGPQTGQLRQLGMRLDWVELRW